MSTTEPMPPSRRRFLLISNPIAGRMGRHLLQPVIAYLEKAGAAVTRAPVGIDAARRALELADRSDSAGAVLVAGGDGSFRMAAAALLGSSLPLVCCRSAPATCWRMNWSCPASPSISRGCCSMVRPCR